MVVKIYVSGISGNKEVKKRQQRVLMILDSRNFKYELIDIAEPGNEEHKDFMQTNSTSLGATIGDAKPRHALPPQIFNDGSYCGDYDQFDMANEIDELEKFLKLAQDDLTPIVTSSAEVTLGNGNETQDAVDNVENEKVSVTEEVVEDEVNAKDEGNEKTNGAAEVQNGADENETASAELGS